MHWVSHFLRMTFPGQCTEQKKRVSLPDLRTSNLFYIVYEEHWSRLCETHSGGMKHTQTYTDTHTQTILTCQSMGGRRIQASRCHHMTAFCSFGFMGKVLHTWRWLIVAWEVLGVWAEEDMASDLLQRHHPFRCKQSRQCMLFLKCSRNITKGCM